MIINLLLILLLVNYILLFIYLFIRDIKTYQDIYIILIIPYFFIILWLYAMIYNIIFFIKGDK